MTQVAVQWRGEAPAASTPSHSATSHSITSRSVTVAAAPALLGEPVTFSYSREHLAMAEPEGLAEHLDRFGPRHRAVNGSADSLIRTLEAVGLTGRGGAHFPVAAKWRAVRATGRPATVVANGAESEPASAKDRALLTRRPHLVLDGLVCAAEAVDADELVIWTHHGDGTHRVLAAAIEQRRAAGWAEPRIRLVSAPARYLSGESAAVVRALSGGPVLPQFRRVPAAVSGVRGRPTLVHNVETLARVGLAARGGGVEAPPTTLLTVVAGGRLTVIEADPLWTVADAVWAATAATPPTPAPAQPQAVLLGGYGGTWVAWTPAAHLAVHEPAMRAAGVSLGAGVLAPLPAGACGLAETAGVASYLAASSAGQCGPCRFGLPAVAKAVQRLADGRSTDLRLLHRHLGEVDGRGGCHHPDGAVRFVASALATFADDVAAHARGHPCPATARLSVLPVPRW